MSQETEILKKAREIIADPIRWTKGAFALDKNKETALPNWNEAVCWCAEGAIQKAVWDMKAWHDSKERSAVMETACALLEAHIPSDYEFFARAARYNDHENTTHEMVLAWFDKAIAEGE